MEELNMSFKEDIDEVMNGTALDEIIEALITEDQLSRLSELE